MIRFSKYMWLYFLISGLVIIPGLISLVSWGLRPAIDFTGGTLLEVQFPQVTKQQELERILQGQNITASSIQNIDGKIYLIRLKPQSTAGLRALEESLVSKEVGAVLLRNETVGPVLGRELLQKTFTAAIFAIVAILSYVAYAFKNIKFGVSAICALIHDLLVVLGVFSLLGHFYHVEVDTLFVTAFLTTMSFSVHDTIVVFDRIRELLKKGERITFETLTDTALTETMGRSFANSITIIFMLLALVLLGGASIKWFVFALLIGTVSGTYSSPFIATPILILWHRFEKRRKSDK